MNYGHQKQTLNQSCPKRLKLARRLPLPPIALHNRPLTRILEKSTQKSKPSHTPINYSRRLPLSGSYQQIRSVFTFIPDIELHLFFIVAYPSAQASELQKYNSHCCQS